MTFIITDDTGIFFPVGEIVELSTSDFKNMIANKIHVDEVVEITKMTLGSVSVWIHY